MEGKANAPREKSDGDQDLQNFFVLLLLVALWAGAAYAIWRYRSDPWLWSAAGIATLASIIALIRRPRDYFTHVWRILVLPLGLLMAASFGAGIYGLLAGVWDLAAWL